jgi:hypothetical protein
MSYLDLSEFLIPVEPDIPIANRKLFERKDGTPVDQEFWNRIVFEGPFDCIYEFPFRNPVKLTVCVSGYKNEHSVLDLIRHIRSGFYSYSEREYTQMYQGKGAPVGEYVKDEPWPITEYPRVNRSSFIKEWKLALVGVHIEGRECRPVIQEGFRLDHTEELSNKDGSKYIQVFVAPI